MRMVDWGTQDRLFPSGYRSVPARYRSAKQSLISSAKSTRRYFFFHFHLIDFSKGHSCRPQSKHVYDDSILFDHLQHGLQQSINFYRKYSENHHRR